MPEITHEHISTTLRRIVETFSAAEHFHDDHVPLSGPEILYTYKDPQRAIEEGVLSVFKAGDTPVIVMVFEKRNDKILLHASRLTDQRVEVFHRGQLFTDLEDNYLSQPLWVSALLPEGGEGERRT